MQFIKKFPLNRNITKLGQKETKGNVCFFKKIILNNCYFYVAFNLASISSISLSSSDAAFEALGNDFEATGAPAS